MSSSSSQRIPRSSPIQDEFSPKLIFELEWKKKPAGSAGKRGEDIRARIGIWDLADPTLDLSSFKSYLCQNLGLSGDVAVSYVDSDSDELPIDSECELREALKYAKAHTKKDKNVLLMIDRLEKQGTSEKSSSKQSSSAPSCKGLFFIQENSSPKASKNNMAPMQVNGFIENERKRDETVQNSPSFLPSSSEAVPPVWFTSYMETLKKDIVKEVSTKAVSDVIGVLKNVRQKLCPTCNRTPPRARHSRETNNEDKQQQRKKKKQHVVEEAESSDTFYPRPQLDAPPLRRAMKSEKCEQHFQRKIERELERLEKVTRIIARAKNRSNNAAALAKNLDKICKLAEASAEPLRASAPLQDKQNEKYNAASNFPSAGETCARMSCSVTGNDSLEKPIGKEIQFESDSDSDIVTIVSRICNESDLDPDYNFEMIETPACFILDKPLNNRGPENPEVQENAQKESFNIVCEADSDRNNNCDSPSYEVLSGNTSSASSIHLDEDHFHTSRNAPGEAPHTDLIDLGNEGAAALVIDPQGKIFENKAKNENENENEESNEIYLEKRPGGAYAFVNQTLPSPAKDASQISKSTIADNATVNSSVKKSSHGSSGSEAEIPATDSSQSSAESREEIGSNTKCARAGESTQSFTSHISHTVGNSIYNFTGVQTRVSHTGPTYTIVDKNVSKGLEETRYTSGENKLGARGCQSRREEKTNSDSRGKYQRGFTSESSACVFTEQPHKTGTPGSNSTRDSSPDFSRPNNDSVHILPETLVSGAVTVASSAYSTARRVLDRIRNMQTGEGNVHAENGVTLGSDVDGYFAMLEEMGFKDADLNARLLSQFNYDMSKVISELVQ